MAALSPAQARTLRLVIQGQKARPLIFLLAPRGHVARLNANIRRLVEKGLVTESVVDVPVRATPADVAATISSNDFWKGGTIPPSRVPEVGEVLFTRQVTHYTPTAEALAALERSAP